MKDLIERLEKLPGADRETDWKIADLFAIPEPWPESSIWPPFQANSRFEKSIPAFTGSIDAAVALAEELLPDWSYSVGRGFAKMGHPTSPRMDVQWRAFNGATALVICVLFAKEQS